MFEIIMAMNAAAVLCVIAQVALGRLRTYAGKGSGADAVQGNVERSGGRRRRRGPSGTGPSTAPEGGTTQDDASPMDINRLDTENIKRRQ